EILAESKRKAFLQDVLGEIEFIGDEIPKQELVRALGISERTAERFIEANADELNEHGFRSLKGQEFAAWKAEFVTDTHVGYKLNPKARKIALFTIDAALSF